MRDVQVLFAVSIVFLIGVHCVTAIFFCNDDCENDGRCEYSMGVRLCYCRPGTSGGRCENVDDCKKENYFCGTNKDVKCLYDSKIEKAICKCDDQKKLYDFTDKKCRAPCNNNCYNSGECVDNFCRCKTGTSGDLCATVDDCTDDFCGTKEDVICVYDPNLKRASCKCYDTRKEFDSNRKECRILCRDDCQNGGKCEYFRGIRLCNCKPGTSGDLCETVDDCKKENFCGIKTNVYCVYDTAKERAICKCDDQNKLFDSSTKTCRDPCRNSCNNNGECIGRGDVKFCRCKAGTSGDLCATVDDCTDDLCGTKDDVMCVYDATLKGGSCKCYDFTKDFDSNTKECRTRCRDDCQNGGKCEFSRGIRVCNCKPGTSGGLCETVDDCNKDNFCGSRTDVKCVYDAAKERATCKCEDQNKLFDSSTKKCRAPCYNSCHNAGECVSSGDVKFCRCKPGTSGDLCDTVDDCTHGLCGTNQDVICVYDPISKRGSCKCYDSTKSYDSIRKECRRDLCEDYTCYNGGICIKDNAGTPSCYCKAPFDGERCEKKEDGCLTYICENGGVCKDDGEGPICYCRMPFIGERCERQYKFLPPDTVG